ncbi:MAG: ferritin-like domain-containing protein [Ruminococcaceae bacterium]|nr:ferritin-like domain-containing protein [Oscillospiraceae bacterium]
MQLTQKERDLIKDLKDQEQLCIDKYSKHAECASDSQLKALFTGISGTERQHLETLTQIENGTVPPVGNADKPLPTFHPTYSTTETPQKKNDCYLCTDLLTTEKHASHLYDTCVFEFDNQGVRKVLASIQEEEQQHGKAIYDYMKVNSMY